MYQHRLTTLENKLRLVTIPMPQLESITVMVGVGAGSRHETKRINGLAHFLEHMAFRGTKRRPSTSAITTEIDSVGGTFGAFTDKERTFYYIKLAAKHKELAFDLLSDLLTNSLFRKEEIEKERGVIIEEINMYEDTPMRHIWDVFMRLLYGNNSMGWDIAGEKETVRQIQRKDFLNYINRLYLPQNMVVGTAGKVSQKEINELTKKYFGSLEKKGKKQTKPVKLDQKGSRVKLAYKKTDQAHFCLGVPAYKYTHPDRFALIVLATILGGGMSSRLSVQIRENRGLAYYVQTNTDFFTDSGFLVNRAGVKLSSVNEAIEVTLSELQSLVGKLVGPQELKKAKELNKGRLILALEDSEGVAERYTNQLLLEEKIRTPEETIRLIDKVTAADVQRVAKDIFKPTNFNLALIGPFKDESRFKKLLKA